MIHLEIAIFASKMKKFPYMENMVSLVGLLWSIKTKMILGGKEMKNHSKQEILDLELLVELLDCQRNLKISLHPHND